MEAFGSVSVCCFSLLVCLLLAAGICTNGLGSTKSEDCVLYIHPHQSTINKINKQINSFQFPLFVYRGGIKMWLNEDKHLGAEIWSMFALLKSR